MCGGGGGGGVRNRERETDKSVLEVCVFTCVCVFECE